jgi:RNA polymerase sigma-70 factor (ECF subfamily)
MQVPSFEEIVDRYYAMLYRFALSLARNEADAGDLTQQTFSVWAAKGHLLRDPAKVKSWLFTTLYREFISNRRREARWPTDDVADLEDELPAATPDVVDVLDAGQVMSALQCLDEAFRVPLMLFYLQQHSYEEIAQILEIPIGTVMSRLARGKQKLHHALVHQQASPVDPQVVRLPMRNKPVKDPRP